MWQAGLVKGHGPGQAIGPKKAWRALQRQSTEISAQGLSHASATPIRPPTDSIPAQNETPVVVDHHGASELSPRREVCEEGEYGREWALDCSLVNVLN